MASSSIELFGKTYHIGFAATMPPLEPEEERSLEDSIKQHGMKMPIRVVRVTAYDDAGKPTGEASTTEFNVVDGWNRLQKAKKLKLAADAFRIEEEDSETPKKALQAIAICLNACRRQLGKKERVKAIADLRALGYKYREIAQRLNVPPATVHRMATGKNGGSHGGARQPGVKEKDKAEAKAQAQDRLGNPLPEGPVAAAFADSYWLTSLVNILKTAQERVQQIAQLPSQIGLGLDLVNLENGAKGLMDAVEGGRPHCVCPGCAGKVTDRSEKCKVCKGKGWLTQAVFHSLPKTAREKAGKKSEAKPEKAEGEVAAK